ncbi:MAG: chromate transporter [Blautia sp.]|nr:chromate transporter [Blautia sp.]
MVLLRLFWSFVKIGFTSFGGLSMIPLITHEVTSNGWMDAGQVSDIIGIAEMTPGPLGLNCATFAGMQAAGIFGALTANLGILMPSLTIGLLAGIFLEKFRDNRILKGMLVGIRPMCLGLMFGVIVQLSMTSYLHDGVLSPASLCIGAVCIFLLVVRKWEIPLVIILSAAAGVVCFGILHLP